MDLNDRQRAVMDEVTMMIERERRALPMYNFADKFTSKDIMELLEPHRRAFDYAIANCLAKHGIAPGNIRSQLDQVWYSKPVSQGDRRYRRWFDGLINPIGNDNTMDLKIKTWNSYLDRVLQFTEQVIVKS
ncbi:MAG: hypothetical protein H6508_01765 [Calditrichaeota bacterium]|nr:hypothetical protein [Calditrichota bacterium]